MLGYASSMAFFNVADPVGGTSFPGVNWRIMLASAGVPALVLVLLHRLVPESPRWQLSKSLYAEAWAGMKQIRRSELQAARDLFMSYQSVEEQRALARVDARRTSVWFQARSIFRERRNRRAFIASEICMFLQQFSGKWGGRE
jgi:MFS family permease